jgi:uncharacterized protein (TIGR03083 family)
MQLRDAPVIDVRPVLTEERADLLRFLAGLTAEEWETPTAAPGWRVKDVALHLLDDDLGWLSRGRDGDRSGRLTDTGEYGDFVAALAAKNQRFVDGTAGLSRRVIIDLLAWAGRQMDDYYAAMDLHGEGAVRWASSTTVPVWFDIAQDLTERWVHQQQMRDAVGQPGLYARRYLPRVLRTFVWAFPHQYAASADVGTTVELDLGSGGAWSLIRVADRWELEEGSPAAPHAALSTDADTAWRLLTGAAVPERAIQTSGPAALLKPLLTVRGILV